MRVSRLTHHPHLVARVLRTLAVRAAPYAAALLVLTALALTAARLAIGSLPEHRDKVTAWLETRIGHRISIGGLNVRWDGWTPEIGLTDVEIRDPEGQVAAHLARLELALDPLASVMSGGLALRGVRVEGAGLAVVRGADGAIALHGLGGGGDHEDLAALLLAAPAPVEFQGQVQWEDRGRGLAPVNLREVTVRLRNAGERHVIEATARIPGGQARYLLDAHGDLLAGAWGGLGFLEVQGLGLGRWLGSVWPDRLAVHSGAADLRIWAEWRDGRAQRVVGQLAARNAAIDLGPDAVNLSEARARFQALRLERGWHVALADLSLATDRGALEAASVEVRLPGRGSPWPVIAHVPALRLEAARGPAAQSSGSGALGRVLGTSPSGAIRDLWAAYGAEADANPSLHLSAGLDAFGLWSAADVAGVRGLTGRLWLRGLEGRLILDGGPVTADLPHLFSDPLVLGKLMGQLFWREVNAGWVVGTRSLVVENPDLKLEVAGELARMPDPAATPYISLLAHLDGPDLIILRRYLPRPAMKPRTYDWLVQAFQGGRVTAADILVHGPLASFPFAQPVGRFEALVGIEDVVLDYLPGWPAFSGIRGNLAFRGPAIAIQAEGTRVFDARLQGIRADIPDLADEFPMLAITGQAETSGADGLRFIREAPLDTALKQRFKGVTVEGTLGLDLRLDVPLAHDDPRVTQVQGKLGFRDNRVLLDQVEFAAATGSLTFTRDGFQAEGLRARIADVPVTLAVEPATVNGQSVTRLRLAGTVAPSQLGRLFGTDGPPAPLWSVVQARLQGGTAWQAVVNAPPADAGGERQLSVTVSSDLRGLRVDLPLPLGKGPGQSRQLQVEAALGSAASQLVRVRYGEDVAATLALARGPGRPRLQGAEIQIRRGAELSAGAPPSGINLAADLETVLLLPWIDLAGAVAGAEQGAAASTRGRQPPSEAPLPKHLDISAKRFDFGTQAVNNTRLTADFEPASGWSVVLRGEGASGVAAMPPAGSNQPVRVTLDRLALVPVEGSSSTLRASDPRGLPTIEGRCKEFSFDGRALGALTVAAQPDAEGMSVSSLRLESPQLTADASGHWAWKGGQQLSRFRVALSSPDLGKFLDTLGYEKAGLEGGRIRMEIDASWPGSPAAFSLASSRGRLAVKIKDGALTDVEPGAAGRVFGLLSVQALPRRLTLDFKDLFGKGFRYERIEGTFNVEGGNAYTQDLMLKGDAANLEIAGRVGLTAEDYDELVTVTPSVSTTLPIAGALVGGPIGAVAGLVAGTLFKNEINRAASFQYTVKGPWAKPVVERVAQPTPPAWE